MKSFLYPVIILLSFFVIMGIHSDQRDSYRYFGPPLNTQNVEYNPIISPRNHYLVFQSNRPGGKGGMDIWVSENRSYPNRIKFPEWGSPENFEELNTPSFEGMFSILFGTEDDRPEEIYFTSVASEFRDGYKGLNIYFSERIADSKNWKKPIHLNDINSNFNDRMPAISPNGKVIVFSSDRPGGYGGFDLWIAFRESRSSKWSEPINMGSRINSNFNEIVPNFHWDGETLYFSSDRNNANKKFRFFLSNWSDQNFCRGENFEKVMKPYRFDCWDDVKELGYPFNTQVFSPETSVGTFDRYDPSIPLNDFRNSDNEGISISYDDLWVYYSSNRPGGQGQFDIYRSIMPDDMRKSYDFILNGLVLDGSEQKMIGLDSTLKIFDETNPPKVITSSRIGGDLKPINASDKVKNFETTIKTGKLYRIEVSSPGFIPTEIKVDLRGNIGRNKSRYETIVLEKIKKEIPKPEGILFSVYDKKSGDKITNAKLILFTEKSRKGTEIENINGEFFIKDYPEEDFEILARANGYKDDTFFYKLSQIPEIVGEENKLYLTNLKDIDKIYSTIIYFPTNVDEINSEDRIKLDLFAEYLIKNPTDKIEIGGHTDNVASREYNTKLSQSRADTVRNYLLKKSISGARMTTRAYYYSQPAEDNSTAEGRSLNRRVNFKKLE
ncbi:OmpA family protein [Leptospira sp. GIMC2001]|uniref:OmpA family protein n=1 Tax=Leptospira sp. GIMC2001 TaxID=1513297 RepID=UPI00234B6240|nr:OmpA family protein [Leptospira sp. GIMC2001]WCL48972.1 OmpA family protein [Leptospira sp. GIMC2001]